MALVFNSTSLFSLFALYSLTYAVTKLNMSKILAQDLNYLEQKDAYFFITAENGLTKQLLVKI